MLNFLIRLLDKILSCLVITVDAPTIKVSRNKNVSPYDMFYASIRKRFPLFPESKYTMSVTHVVVSKKYSEKLRNKNKAWFRSTLKYSGRAVEFHEATNYLMYSPAVDTTNELRDDKVRVILFGLFKRRK